MGHILFQAVVMRTGGDDQEANGLYRIKSTSHSLDDSSHVVAFEDRGDATNFCYLLQSFFEDLDNFSTDIIPIPIEVRIFIFLHLICCIFNMTVMDRW